MIREFLSNNGLIEKVLTVDEIENLTKRNKINIMMGQTFDSGQPIDMMKYGLFIMNLQDMLGREGANVSSKWLVADHFMTSINEDKEREEAEEQAKNRINYLQRLNKAYGGKIGFVLSSKLSETNEYKSNLVTLKKEAEENPRFRKKVLDAIPKDRRDNPKSINYPLEELAVIQTLNTDIKVGPKYEFKYDVPAREFSSMIGFNQFSAIHLKNCYPFGNPKIDGEIKKEIEEFGVLPYKLGSKGLAQYRIDPINDFPERARELINSTTDIRALKDLHQIFKLISMKTQMPIQEIITSGLSELKKSAQEKYDELIRAPLKNIYQSL